MNNWKVIFATMIIFAAGAVTGGLAVNDIQHSHPKNNARPTAVPAEDRSASTNAQTHSGDADKPPRLPEVLSKRFCNRWTNN
jgi:hypothetical protein